jgi:hypothetical protein
MKKFLAVLIVVSFYSFASYAQDVHLPGLLSACDYCIASQGISPVEVGSTGARYDLRYLRLQDMYEAGKKTGNPSNDIETYVTHQFSFYYHITGSLSASLFVPFSSRSASGSGEAPHDPLDSMNVRHSSQEPQHHVGDHPFYYKTDFRYLLLARYSIKDDDLYL